MSSAEPNSLAKLALSADSDVLNTAEAACCSQHIVACSLYSSVLHKPLSCPGDSVDLDFFGLDPIFVTQNWHFRKSPSSLCLLSE